ncbi:MAG: entericidin A/B family lipoprotein [Azospirillaceae bacterium]|nr:entericidin A/B family lipoprotein [Azospirillaceae bacterium]
MPRKHILLVFLLLALGACHTTAGVGEDISKTGSTIEKSADKAAP